MGFCTLEAWSIQHLRQILKKEICHCFTYITFIPSFQCYSCRNFSCKSKAWISTLVTLLWNYWARKALFIVRQWANKWSTTRSLHYFDMQSRNPSCAPSMFFTWTDNWHVRVRVSLRRRLIRYTSQWYWTWALNSEDSSGILNTITPLSWTVIDCRQAMEIKLAFPTHWLSHIGLRGKVHIQYYGELVD